MIRNGRAHIKVSAAVLGIVAIAGCSSSSKPSATSTATTLPRVTSTTLRRRTKPTTTTTAAVGTPTTSGTAVHSSGSPAVSASFVSPSQGFALEQTGTVAATTDGGHSWHRVGSLATHDEEIIRYIDPADGFAFARRSGPLMITHDGGATWTVTPTPFSNVYDLAIARGVIDVAAFQQSPKPVFRIWTSPIAHLVWNAVPPVLNVGAGPIPTQQIVLNGGRGWILGVNRLVIAGARLDATSHWAAWTPPCLHEFGPAYLSASTSSDLVASCDEGVWGGNFSGITHTVWFSHNGGSTFVRETAPVFGPVLSPNAETAVVAGGETLRRTTDGGATWTTVAHLAGDDTTDSGFTTSTQGFVITHGQMLMTRDAGASWQPVTLP